MKNNRFIIVFLLLMSAFCLGQGSPISGIVTDYNGGWFSNTRTGIAPNNHHNLVAFQSGGIWYSTGVNDALVSTVSGGPNSFEPAIFRALTPIGAVSDKIGQGSAADGDPNVAVSMAYRVTAGNTEQYIVDGQNGLDLSTFSNNVGGTFSFPLKNLEVTKIGDGEPDLIYFNAASVNHLDPNIVVNLYNENTLIGSVTTAINTLPSIGRQSIDRFNTTTGQGIEFNGLKNIQALSIELSEFGSVAAVAEATRLELVLSTQSDPSFLAINVNSVQVCSDIIGTVFEDVNYAGGMGRNKISSSGMPRSNVRVELYDDLGNYVSATSTDAGGTYKFNVPIGDYFVRVVNETVTSSRPGSATGLVPIQPFRTDVVNAAVQEVLTKIGGEAPALVDAEANTAELNLTALTTVHTTAQSVASVQLTSTGISEVDFGFNFSTIVNTNSAGQGSLSQFITNSNALLNAGLNQENQPAGVETSIFMIPSDALVNGVAIIHTSTALPPVTDAFTNLDATTQTTNIGDTNPGTVGSGGTVGVQQISLPLLSRPEVELVGSNNNSITGDGIAFTKGSSNSWVKGFALHGFYRAVRSTSDVVNIAIEGNLVGSTAASTESAMNNHIGILILSNSSTIQNNSITTSQSAGIRASGADNINVVSNEIFANGLADDSPDAIAMINSSGFTITDNRIRENFGNGISISEAKGTNLIKNNTIRDNTLAGNGIQVSGTIGLKIEHNILYQNAGRGIGLPGVNPQNSQVFITQNSIYSNGLLGIDLNHDNVTLNDAGDVDSGDNDVLNFPVFEFATIDDGQLLLGGCAPGGSVIEVYLADVSSTSGAAIGDNRFGLSQDYGEGKTFIATLTEGGSLDTADAECTLPIDEDGNDHTSMKSFRFSLPVPSGVRLNDLITATASTGEKRTSEFSPTIQIIGQDYGDAPDTYSTLLSSNGARHVVSKTWFLGPAVDIESDGQPGSEATSEGLDDDGITIASATIQDRVAFPGRNLTFDIAANKPLNSTGYLNAWLDINGDGDFLDPNEQIITDRVISQNLTRVTHKIPAETRLGITFIRFRFSSEKNLAHDGLAKDGEVEDYRIRIKPATIITNRRVTFRVKPKS